jgi:hypothetical protein
MSLAAGTQLGRYEIRSQLGAGRMGEVRPLVAIAHGTPVAES